MSDITSRLTDNQLKVLFSELHQSRVGFNQKGFAHVQQWDVRRFLIRVFGFGGYDTELVSIECVREIEHQPSNPSGKSRWTVVYRVHQRLTIKDIAGNPIASYDGVATGDAQNQPGLGDAHDGAVKEADSQSLKRAAVNLGDAFGLSLYNGGKTDAVVRWSAAHPEPASDAQSVPEDPPVLPDPETPQPGADAEESPKPSPAARAVRSVDGGQQAQAAAPATAPQANDERQTALAEMQDLAKSINFADGLPAQFQATFGHAIEQGTAAEFREATALMRGTVAA